VICGTQWHARTGFFEDLGFFPITIIPLVFHTNICLIKYSTKKVSETFPEGQESTFGIVTSLQAGQSGVQTPGGARDFLFSKKSRPALPHPSLLFSGH